nr:Uncharacterised protein [Streptococcus thermophilus]
MTTRSATHTLSAIVCAALLPLGLVACAQDDPAQNATPSPETTTETVSEETEPESEDSSTTVTVSEAEEDPDAAAAADPAGAPTGPCEWTPAEEGQMGDTVSTFCDGQFAAVGKYATDGVSYLHWNGQTWEDIPHDGRDSASNLKCYDHDKVREMGAPEEFVEKLTPCR